MHFLLFSVALLGLAVRVIEPHSLFHLNQFELLLEAGHISSKIEVSIVCGGQRQ
jgi:hypothetical protein